jgi:hypothetical protein
MDDMLRAVVQLQHTLRAGESARLSFFAHFGVWQRLGNYRFYWYAPMECLQEWDPVLLLGFGVHTFWFETW